MKTKLLTLSLLLVVKAAVAQGKVTFGNNSDRLYVMPSFCLPADAALANQPIPQGPLPSGITLVAGLYAGTSSTSLTLQSSTTLLTGTGWLEPGRQMNRLTTLTVPGGVPQWFQVAIWDSVAPSPGLSPTYAGCSPVFQAVPSTSINFPFLYQTTAPVNSTWAPGNIVLSFCPEPSSTALTLLGLIAVIFRRRHQPA